MASFPATGVCYYPEHWPQSKWASDAQSMVEAGLSWVRIAEFSWAVIEPSPGKLSWQWLDDAVETLGQAGLKIIMCTPTATPPKWLVDQMPDMIAIDANGQPRKFGSRRHYSFAHQGYRHESQRITKLIAERYGNNPYVQAWQTDNEYGCHDTAVSYCPSALHGFRRWLAERYGDIDRLNQSWGNVFWSMTYRNFDEIDLPNLTVTEANPAHALDFYRYSSDAIKAFNLEQVAIIRKASPDRPISHNYMGMFNQFDHRVVAEDLDIAAWDSYPLGMLQNMQTAARKDEKLEQDCLRTGDPDFQAFHHDLYRGMGRLWVMEQQPGPVNWARHNVIPAPGAVRMWSWEAVAHGAEVVSYFRWRQSPFAQEQMHAGLKLRDDTDAPGLLEVQRFNDEINKIELPQNTQAPVALIHDYTADWMTMLDGQTEDFHYLRLLLDVYGAARQNGATVDVIGPQDNIDGYKFILLPSLMTVSDDLAERLENSSAVILAGPRTGAKTADFQLPENLAPGPLSRLIGATITRVDALPRQCPVELTWKGEKCRVSVWREEARQLSATGENIENSLMTTSNKARYLLGWPDAKTLRAVLKSALEDAGLKTHDLPPYLRVRERGDLAIFINYGPEKAMIPDSIKGEVILGDRWVEPAGVAVMKTAP